MHAHDITELPSRVRRAGLGGRVRPRGPWPVRPRVVAVGARPVQPARPPALVEGGPVPGGRQRVLDRRPVRAARPRGRIQIALGLAALAVVTTTVVVALGLLAGAVAEWRSTEPAPVATVAPAEVAGDVVSVTVADEVTVWEVAEQVAPGASGVERAELAERIVADNGLTSVRVHPGQVLRVGVG